MSQHTGCILACLRGGLLWAQARACGVTVRLVMSKRKAVGADSSGASQHAATDHVNHDDEGDGDDDDDHVEDDDDDAAFFMNPHAEEAQGAC